MPDVALERTADLDCLIVVCGYGARQHSTPEFLSKLRANCRGVRQVGGVDAGPWILATAGLLEGRTATMHWLDLAAFEEEFPNVSVSQQRFVIDGRIVTAGGATTVLELMLRIIRDTFGELVSFDVSNTFVYNSDRLSVEQRGAKSLSIGTRVPQLIRTVEAMRSNLSEPLSIAQIAGISGSSLRNLNRLFRRELDITPGRYYGLIRLSHARSLAEDSNLSANQVAAATGFSAGASFCRAFKNRFGATLMSFRTTKLYSS